MLRYDVQGIIKGICETCGESKEIICYEDKLYKKVYKDCKECIESKGIKIKKRI